jgi:hypothetical protein
MEKAKPSETEKVDEYMNKFQHPLKEVMEKLREFILSIDKTIGEEVKWNAPTFFYTGELKKSDPKVFKRYLIVSNVHRKDYIMLVLPHGADADDNSGFLEGEYTDGRRLLKFHDLKELESKKKQLKKVVKDLLKNIETK